MAYRLPNFNLDCRISNNGGTTPGLVTFPGDVHNCQKYLLSRQQPQYTALTWWWGQLSCIFRVEYGPFIAIYSDDITQWGLAWIECPAFSGYYYRVFSYEVAHQGFANEYIAIHAPPCDPNAFPIWPASASFDAFPGGSFPPNMGPPGS